MQSAIGAQVECTKQVTESDVLSFADITGDHSPNHVDEAAMKKTRYGGRIAHGALLVGYMSRASTMVVEKCGALVQSHYPVSLGYDRIRLLQAVRIGDEVHIRYVINRVEDEKRRTIADVQMTNQRQEVCAVATHIMSWLEQT